MNIDNILKNLDDAFNRADLVDAENILKTGIEQAVSEGDDGSLLQLLNEYLGFLRETSRAEESFAIADKIKALMVEMGLTDSIPYATSLLNIANAYRAGGRLEDSLSAYNEVERIYRASLPTDSMLLASFYNNKALLLQEMNDMESAIHSLNQALVIVESNNEPFELAVTHSNLANSYMGLGDYRRALSEATVATELFNKHEILDAHTASALYSLGISMIKTGDSENGIKNLHAAADLMERFLGKNEFWYRIQDAIKACEKELGLTENCVDQSSQTGVIKGLDLARSFYEDCFKPVIEQDFAGYKDKIAVALFGRGSDCYGYDDEASMDHDWGPGFVVLLSPETYEAIGARLTEAYNDLPKEYKGFKVAPVVSGHKRRGVFTVAEYFEELLGKYPITKDDYKIIPDYALSTAVNGEIFTDPEGIVTAARDELKKGYPEDILYLKLAESMSKASQALQYNYARVLKRGDELTASMMLADGLKEALKTAHYLENKYPPHDKWLFKSLGELEYGPDLVPLFNTAFKKKEFAPLFSFIAARAYEEGFISDTDDYLDHHRDELLFKANAALMSTDELVKKIARTEFEAFDKVKNEGGRASCQNDWYTFSIMRESQYMTWTRPMLMQYYYDFTRELSYGHNLITEKYGRMMESTAPERYAEIKDNFPEISEEKKNIIEAITGIQTGWMHEFCEEFPRLGGRARSVDTFDDNAGNTSYETYLRGEISTYSDKMLQLYAAFIVGLSKEGRNLAYETMLNSVRMYGYESLEDAEQKA